MIVKLLTEHYLERLSLKEGCRGSSESTHVKMPHCWKSYALAQLFQILSLNNVGIHGGVCRVTRKMVDIVLTTLITGSPFGLGTDPELNVSTCRGTL